MSNNKLVFTKTELHNDFSKLNKIIYGFPKSGKTTFASKIIVNGKEPLFITTEQGHNAISVYAQSVLSDDGNDWEKFIKVRDYIISNANDIREQHSCIVIDLISDLDDMCTTYILKKNKVKSLADLEWGKGWSLQQTEFQSGINPLFRICSIVFITHTKERELSYNGDKIRTQSPTLSSRAFDFINGKVDIIGFIVPANNKREKPTLTFRPSTMAIAGSRFSFMTTDFILDYEDMQGSYNKINDFFQKNITKEKTNDK